ncbi:hypothetical protein HYPSUDRAFT_205802 [Hypholoma sublateritium FD-334 SS-4]|uniref:C2H2-type domain-containing protein n=1 Tax=Hypholoma sublateritium (strain FD-334 SS-4) TaxID=945553 RepID=A0A0D2KTJ3_HYPSF|nr:hypothetical protein HYPSUDRAFT_205802 [Hypholoma sublateritium FD-334 SS-4]
MAKKKNKQIIRPWCWYCEREFEDEKVLMQHQKAKHFKCNMCPRRLNTAGGLAVHIQQVHKLEPENLPRIENALPGRDGYEVEIFGMEGIPAPDVADYKRRKEIELGLSAGSISQPPPKRAKVENRPLSEEELRRQLAEHKALMGLSAPETSTATESSSGAVYGAPQTYATPPQMPPPMSGGMPPMPPPGMFPPGMPPPGAFPPGGFPPFMPGFPPGGPPPGFAMPNFPPGAPPFPPGPPGALGRPPFPPPPGFGPPGMGLPGAPAFSPPPPPQFVPAQMQQNAPGPPPGNASQPPPQQPPQSQQLQQSQQPSQPQQAPSRPEPSRTEERVRQPVLTLPDPSRSQTNAEFKKLTDLKFKDANFSPDEHRAIHPKYFLAKLDDNSAISSDESRGKKRARAEDFL